MSTKHVAFLRGINVGGNRVIKMTDLRACFEGLGFTEVSTILQSGNVIFTSNARAADALRRKIETALTRTFQYPAKAQVYPFAMLQTTVREYPFDSSRSDFQYHVVFVDSNAVDALWKDATDLDNTAEEIVRGEPFIYWRVRKGMSTKSVFAKLLSKAIHRDHVTVRNLNTLKKMAGM